MSVASAVRTVAPAPAVHAKAPAMLRVGPANDPLEAEADRAADAVLCGRRAVIGGVSGGEVRRKCAACEADEPEGQTVQLKRQTGASSSSAAAAAAPMNLGPGRPLSAEQRAYFEPRFGHDFSAVRLHDDRRSAASAGALNAQAFTAGQHVVFAPGNFDLQSDAGLKLIAHELAHTIQNRAANGTSPVRRTPAQVEADAAQQLEEVNRRLQVADYPGRDRDLAAKEALEFVLRPDEEEEEMSAPSIGPPPVRDLITTYHDPRSDYGERALKAFDEERAENERRAFLDQISDRTAATRYERYNINLRLQGKTIRDELTNTVFDPMIITLDELHEERKRRGELRMRDCRKFNIRPGSIQKCRLKVKTEYYGEDYMERSFAAVRAAWNNGAYIERIKNAGPVGLAGRVVGRGIDYFSGSDKWEERLGLVGGFVDVTAPVAASGKTRRQTKGYQGSGGLEVGRGDIIDVRNAPTPRSMLNVLEESPAGRFVAPPGSRSEAARQKYGVSANAVSMDLGSRPLSAAAGRTLRSLGVKDEDNIAFNQGEEIWFKIQRGEAKIDAYLRLSGDKLIAGIRSAKSKDVPAESDVKEVSFDMIKAFYAFRQSANTLARQTNVKTLRLEADVVTNTKEIPEYLKRMKFTEKPDTPFSYYLDIPVR